MTIRGRAPDALTFAWREAPGRFDAERPDEQDRAPRGQAAARRDAAPPTEHTENPPRDAPHLAAHESHDARQGVTAPVRATPRIAATVPGSAIARDTSARDQDARDALSAAGYKPCQARAAVDRARPHVGADGTLEQLIREALRRCTR